jgi:hypothetical protein
MRPGELKKPQTPYVFPGVSARAVIEEAKASAIAAQLRPGMPKNGTAGQSAGPPGFNPEPGLVHEPGGDIARGFAHDAFTIYEQLYRVLPDASWFSPNVNSQHPVQFEIGAFTVPSNMHLWLFDYEFSIFRQSGVDAGDIMPAEEGRFSGIMGFDLNFSGRRLSNILFQLDPVPVQITPPTFQPPIGGRAVSSQFDAAAAQSFAATSGQGLSLLPVTSRRYGARDAPWTLVAKQGDRVSLNVVIFKPVPTPIVTIQGRSAGYLIHANASSSLIERLRPR